MEKIWGDERLSRAERQVTRLKRNREVLEQNLAAFLPNQAVGAENFWKPGQALTGADWKSVVDSEVEKALGLGLPNLHLQSALYGVEQKPHLDGR